MAGPRGAGKRDELEGSSWSPSVEGKHGQMQLLESASCWQDQKALQGLLQKSRGRSSETEPGEWEQR